MTPIRPSKIFLFDLLEKELAGLRGAVGIDAASANFKNRGLFKTDKYYGVDIDLAALHQGVAKFADGATFGIHADLRDLRKLPESAAAAVVSTNTLHQLTGFDRTKAVAELTRLVAPSGTLILEMPIDDMLAQIDKDLKTAFAQVRTLYYKNPISRAYEKFWERGGDLGSHPVAGRRPFRALAWLLSRLEYLTWFWRAGNRYAIIRCRRKITGTATARSGYDTLPLTEHGIYGLI